MTETVEILILSTRIVHIQELANNIRQKDRKEIEIYGVSAKRGIWNSYKRGLGNRTALFDGKVAACWGCAGTYMGSVGAPWLLTTDEIYKISPITFAKLYKAEVKKMLNIFPRLENYVDSSYSEAIRLLKVIGFEIGEPETLGKGVYRKFSMQVRG